jgi:hypothetical protein
MGTVRIPCRKGVARQLRLTSVCLVVPSLYSGAGCGMLSLSRLPVLPELLRCAFSNKLAEGKSVQNCTVATNRLGRVVIVNESGFPCSLRPQPFARQFPPLNGFCGHSRETEHLFTGEHPRFVVARF